MDEDAIRLHPDRIVRTLLGIVLLLLVASYLGQISKYVFGYDSVKGLVQMFNVNEERNLPTFFSVLLALSCAFLLTMHGVVSRISHQRDSAYWFALGLGFLFVAYDEAFQVHEQLIAPTRALLGEHATGVLYFSWVVPGIAGVAAVLAVFTRFALRLPRATRRRFLLSFAIYVGGCIGMELVSGRYVELHGGDLVHSLLTTIEEGLEMLGLTCFVRALLLHITASSRHLKLDLGAAQQSVAHS